MLMKISALTVSRPKRKQNDRAGHGSENEEERRDRLHQEMRETKLEEERSQANRERQG